ncbi:MAG: methylated-DNA--[Clostridia bacterium]|nr:methylated-DNA--[protein]-cysteine S-methyltransferase [Clostridia bacterium]
MSKTVTAVVPSPTGNIRITVEGDVLTGLCFTAEACTDIPTETLRRVAEQLDEYFAGVRQAFDLPYRLHGTPFQMRVWQALCEIPYGETRTYREIAVRIGAPKASRAVGMANHNNPIDILVPCHRVIGTNGKLTGYADGLEIKAYLLNLERKSQKSNLLTKISEP